jgi:cyclophilin family peptidyl-prolyl cis-trans isomerase
MKPLSPSPPTNGSQFLIMLRPEATWAGQATVLGQVVDGLDVVQRISRMPNTQQTARPYFKPLKEVRMRKITVAEKPVAP